MPKLRQFLYHPVQQFATNTTVFKIRQQRKDHNLPGFPRAEAVANNISIEGADVARKCTGVDIFSPGFRGDTDRAKLFLRESVFPCFTAQRYALGGVFW